MSMATMMVQLLPAVRAGVVDLQIAVQQFPFAAIWALAAKTFYDGRPGFPLVVDCCLDGLI